MENISKNKFPNGTQFQIYGLAERIIRAEGNYYRNDMIIEYHCMSTLYGLFFFILRADIIDGGNFYAGLFIVSSASAISELGQNGSDRFSCFIAVDSHIGTSWLRNIVSVLSS